MVPNRIRVKLAEANMSAAALSEKMPDNINKVCMSFIQAGKVLPTKEAMRVMCEVFGCTPTDIYAEDDIDLLSMVRKQTQRTVQAAATPTARDSSIRANIVINPGEPNEHREADRHTGMQQVRVWMPATEKAALVRAVKGLGYISLAEWFREMYRKTLKEYIALNLKDTKLHEAIPLTTQNQTRSD